VSINGKWLFNGLGYSVSGSNVIITGPLIGAGQVVSIVSFTQYTVPQPMAFRIFQDMRGVQLTYNITPATTTVLLADLSDIDDTIYVSDVMTLTQPNFAKNIWGVITIGAERIMYRQWDQATNTVSDLLRGTAGTAINSHTAGASVYNLGSGNLLPIEYQNYVVSDNTIANGTTTIFNANNINLSYESGQGDPAQEVEVYVSGIRVLEGFTVTFNPVQVTFDNAPPAGSDVTILVRRGLSWYQPGTHTASNGVPLQETNTLAARFLRGE
jgi:hypothetical protein